MIICTVPATHAVFTLIQSSIAPAHVWHALRVRLRYKQLRNHVRHVLFFFNDTATTEIYTLSLHDALPISISSRPTCRFAPRRSDRPPVKSACVTKGRSIGPP